MKMISIANVLDEIINQQEIPWKRYLIATLVPVIGSALIMSGEV